jgi:hypothetical protein
VNLSNFLCPLKVHTINIIEEDSNIPKLLIKVGTSNETRDVTYFINSSDYDQLDFSRKFKLNSSSGELYLVTPLDRDLPFGRSLWHFSIMAKRVYSKEPFGFADVVIIVNDINDNTPFFERSLYHAQIVENSPSGTALFLYIHLIIFKLKLKITFSYLQINEFFASTEKLFRIV